MPTLRCPTCGVRFAPDGSKALPFCSERCRQVDLGRWLNEQHGLPRILDPEDDARLEGNGRSDDGPA